MNIRYPLYEGVYRILTFGLSMAVFSSFLFLLFLLFRYDGHGRYKKSRPSRQLRSVRCFCRNPYYNRYSISGSCFLLFAKRPDN